MRESLDTNILIYAIDASQGAKFNIANGLLERALTEQWPITTQVLGEFYAATTRKAMLTRPQANKAVKLWSTLMQPVAASADTFLRAMNYSQRTGTQYWDALILATCAEHRVGRLYTEDIGAQQQALGVGLIKPF
jgi:predicted nucleic acid-binding protein